MAQRFGLDQTDRLILYLVDSLTRGVPDLLIEGGGVLTTMLAKLLFLVDVWSVQASGSQVTDFRYIRYKHGPYPLTQFEERLDNLAPRGIYATPHVRIEDGRKYRIYRLMEHTKTAIDLSPQVRLLAEEVMTTFANQKLEDVLEHVYSLDVVRRVPFGAEIYLQPLAPKIEDAVTQATRLFKTELAEPVPSEHIQALEEASKEASNENVKTALAMRKKQRSAFRLKSQQ